MLLYRIRFELRSSIVTPLKGDTIWGHIVWGIANHEGDAAVVSFLEHAKTDPPALVVSSAFPESLICRPLPLPKDRKDSPSKDDYSKIKTDKKIKYVPASNYFTNTETIDKAEENPLVNIEVMHNTIDRFSNTVLETGLYSIDEKWSKVSKWDVYILSTLPLERIKTLVEWAFENGFGADASTGKGKITNIGNPVEVETKINSNNYMALGPFVDPKNGISELRANIFVRSGKIGGAFASGLSPYKKPVVLYDEGAVFKYDKIIGYTGRLLENMHDTKEFNICQSGFAPVIPVDLSKEL